jgi:hypothetical protein
LRARRGSVDAPSPSSDEEIDDDAVVELGEAPKPRKKQRKERRKLKKKQRKEAAEAAVANAGKEDKGVSSIIPLPCSCSFGMICLIHRSNAWRIEEIVAKQCEIESG